MRLREQALGNKNVVGVRIEKKRRKMRLKQKEFLVKLQVNGVDINPSALSKIEGQHRTVTDKELIAIADVLNVSIDELTGRKKSRR
ncbi:MAG: hypothetical protein RUMPE_00828 [Eubacteriales bacterium SKADARSKE-1]|nr:hypothetical protein [Eubacteriales bacterium SKADARSKE-1]